MAGDALASQEAPKADAEAAPPTLLGADGIQAKGITLYNPAAMRVERYRYRGALISTPWNEQTVDLTGGRFRRTRHDDPRSLEALEEALA